MGLRELNIVTFDSIWEVNQKGQMCVLDVNPQVMNMTCYIINLHSSTNPAVSLAPFLSCETKEDEQFDLWLHLWGQPERSSLCATVDVNPQVTNMTWYVINLLSSTNPVFILTPFLSCGIKRVEQFDLWLYMRGQPEGSDVFARCQSSDHRVHVLT